MVRLERRNISSFCDPRPKDRDWSESEPGKLGGCKDEEGRPSSIDTRDAAPEALEKTHKVCVLVHRSQLMGFPGVNPVHRIFRFRHLSH